MKEISLKPAGTAQNFRIPAVIPQFIAKSGSHIAAIGAAVCFIASLFAYDSVAYVSAFISLGAVCYISRDRKGGAE